jgi:type I restriction-modification system DNA methylase subunit
MDNSDIIKQLREWKYMSGTERSKERVDKSGEVFTPDWLVDEMVEQIMSSVDIYSDEFVFSDSSCGDGQLLTGILIKLLEKLDHKTALERIRGIDIMESNVELCRQRLTCGKAELMEIAKQNIVCRDGLTDTRQDNELFEF